MRNEGELTATVGPCLLNQSPGNMSWHLQTLAKYGFIVQVDGAKGRRRPWKIAPGTNSFNPSEAIPGTPAKTACGVPSPDRPPLHPAYRHAVVAILADPAPGRGRAAASSLAEQH